MFRLLGVSILAVATAAASDVCPQAGGCSEESSWGAGWLQENYALSQRIATDANIATATNVESGALGPLTDGMQASDFSDFAVPFSPKLILAFVTVFILLAAHELWVSGGNKPLLADHENCNAPLLQMAFLVAWFVPFISSSLIVPISLDYAIAMGQSATASGIYLGQGTVFSTLGLIAGRALNKETNWDQAWARKAYVGCACLSLIGYSIIACVSMLSVHWSMNAKQLWFWFSQLLSGAVTFFATLPAITWSTLWNKVTPDKDKTFWMIMTQCCRNGGFILGPPAFAVISYSVRQGREVSPICMMAYSTLGIVGFSLFNLAVTALVFPTYLNPATLPEHSQTTAADNAEQALEATPEQLPEEDRERIVWHMIYYSVERPFSIAAIEVATIMLLEVSYGWSAEFCGFAFIVIAASSLFLSACSTFMLSRKMVTESAVFMTSAIGGLIGVFFLFDFNLEGKWGAASLLAADAIVYGGASVANGIAEGWGCRACKPGTSYSIEVYRLRNMTGVNLSRFLSPIVARFIIDFGGRNIYALLQLTLCTMGTLTVYRTVSLVWKGTRAKMAEEAIESKVSTVSLNSPRKEATVNAEK